MIDGNDAIGCFFVAPGMTGRGLMISEKVMVKAPEGRFCHWEKFLITGINGVKHLPATCHLLKDMGIEPVFQLVTRDRNRLALQSDLLSAYVLGVENVLCITGDHPSLGDHPGAKPVYDLDSVQLLETVPGSKNIILISDGKDTAENINVAYEAARKAANMGARMYTVGVGEKTADLEMMRLAELTNGVYFKADEVSRLKILFGDITEDKTKTPSLALLNTNHFITQDLEDLSASIHGFVDVVPKTTARLLVTTNHPKKILRNSCW